jgi:hypothetical protein
MRSDPAEDWRRLTDLYRGMGEVELHELATDFRNLTGMAQQVLRDELRRRGLNLPLAQTDVLVNGVPLPRPRPLDLPADTGAAGGGRDFPVEYTWKTLLCECNEPEQAWQIGEVLRQAGIESWIEGSGRFSPHGELGLTNPRVLVAADQLDEARIIAARPIPPEIVELSRITLPDFEPPPCPRCGAQDPLLEAVYSWNVWRCETCGQQWRDAENASSDEAALAGG